MPSEYQEQCPRCGCYVWSVRGHIGSKRCVRLQVARVEHDPLKDMDRGPWWRLTNAYRRWVAFHPHEMLTLPPDVALRLSDAADEWESALYSVEPATPSVERRPPARRAPAKSHRKTR
jgi:hypothetical protein